MWCHVQVRQASTVLHVLLVRLLYLFLTLKLEAVRSILTSVNFYQNKRCTYQKIVLFIVTTLRTSDLTVSFRMFRLLTSREIRVVKVERRYGGTVLVAGNMCEGGWGSCFIALHCFVWWCGWVSLNTTAVRIHLHYSDPRVWSHRVMTLWWYNQVRDVILPRNCLREFHSETLIIRICCQACYRPCELELIR